MMESKPLRDIAKSLKKDKSVEKGKRKNVRLIYAFNGVGKTRLSMEFRDLLKSSHSDEDTNTLKLLYYNAFTEDLFYWENDNERKLVIRSNDFTRWILEEEGQENNIVTHFQHYTNEKLTPNFNNDYSEVSFSRNGGNEDIINNIKVSRGEESNFIWCVFFSLLEQIVEVLNVPEPSDRSVSRFNDLEYVFIDDPVSSLDENHLIELAVDIAALIKGSKSPLEFIITTHNSLFYNVLYNELGAKVGYILSNNEDGTYLLEEKKGDSNRCFSYHLFLKQTIDDAIENGMVQKYHFTLLRNLYEKTASFLGYRHWSDLLPDDKTLYYNRIIQFTSHSTLSNDQIAVPTEQEKNTLKLLFKHLIENYKYYVDETV